MHMVFFDQISASESLFYLSFYVGVYCSEASKHWTKKWIYLHL